MGDFFARLERTAFDVDDQHRHIEIHQDAARAAGLGPVLVRVCPAHVFQLDAAGAITVDEAGCLECGTCLAVAPPSTLTWNYPRGGFGVAFRAG